MRILVDADACPVKAIIETEARNRRISVIMFVDTSHSIISDYSEVVMVSKGADAVDFALINRTHCGDIVVTHDYGVAAMALSKRAYPIHPNGKIFTDSNIDLMLMERHIAKKIRQSGERVGHNPKKRTIEQDERFRESLIQLLERGRMEKED